MPPKRRSTASHGHNLGFGQIALEPADPILAPSDQVRDLYRLSDPALSELGLDQLLGELLKRVQEVLEVDTVAILLLDRESGELVARAASGIEEEVEQGVHVPVGLGFAGRIASERVAILIEDANHADIYNPILREKRIRSLLGVPLIVEGDLIGVLHVGSLKPRRFADRDLAVLELAAARAAPAIERARLFSALEHEHQVAMILQRSLLPSSLPTGVGFRAAVRYLAAREEVGGDWYDVIELPRGRLGIAIGDVVGHGIPAAALMGQLRTALRAHALEGAGAAETLERVDRFVQTLGSYAMATAVYGVFDPDTGGVTISSAGHVPPILLGPDGPRRVELSAGAPLGTFPYATFTEHELTLASGDMMVLYTDGLIERRGTPITTSLSKLMGCLAGATSPEEACRMAIDGLVPADGLADDAAMLVLQSTAVPAKLDFELSADPDVLARLRRLMRRWLHERGADQVLMAEVTLAVNEACANAIEHAYSPKPSTFHLEASVKGETLTVVVRDSGQWRTARSGDRGRGLAIMRAAMDAVEVNTTESGTEIVMRRRVVSA